MNNKWGIAVRIVWLSFFCSFAFEKNEIALSAQTHMHLRKGQVLCCFFLENDIIIWGKPQKNVDSHKARCYNEIIKIQKTITSLKYIDDFGYVSNL
jgi:hypothetical protein